MSNGPIDVSITNGGVAVGGHATGSAPIRRPGTVKAGVSGTSDDGAGVRGQSETGSGVWGQCAKYDITGIPQFGPGDGVMGEGENGVHGRSISPHGAGVRGENIGGGAGVLGTSTFNGVQGATSNPNASGVWGENTSSGYGVGGKSAGGPGVYGIGAANGVIGESQSGEGVRGLSHNPNHGGVVGVNDGGGDAVFGTATSGRGVVGHSSSQAGVVGDSDTFDGVFGVSRNPNAAGVSGHSLNADGSVNKVGLAGFFDGTVKVTGDILLSGADCAEQFDMAGAERLDPGTVVVIDQEGALRRSQDAYDKKVAGVISGACGYRPGIVLDKQAGADNRLPVALVGKVYCKVDARHAAIEVGDLLTSSPTPGYAMKADDPVLAFGAVIGKALRPLATGQGLIPILIALQ